MCWRDLTPHPPEGRTFLCFISAQANLSGAPAGHGRIKISLWFVGIVSDMTLKTAEKVSRFATAPSTPDMIFTCQFASFFDASSKFSTRSAKHHNVNYCICYVCEHTKAIASDVHTVLRLQQTWNIIVLFLHFFCLRSLAVESCEMKISEKCR